MVARLLVGGALITLGAGFVWFAGSVIYLGVREFFRIHGPAGRRGKKAD